LLRCHWNIPVKPKNHDTNTMNMAELLMCTTWSLHIKWCTQLQPHHVIDTIRKSCICYKVLSLATHETVRIISYGARPGCTVLWHTGHFIMRMISYARCDANKFESMHRLRAKTSAVKNSSGSLRITSCVWWHSRTSWWSSSHSIDAACTRINHE
jgi:hypothetical protein